jgi:hypothetical protein
MKFDSGKFSAWRYHQMREHKQHHEEMEQQQSIKQWVAILGGIIFTVSLASLLVEWGVMGSTANAHLQVIKSPS